jgi:hypothetical protein
MRGQPTTSAPAGQRRRRESLSECYRAWRLRPRKHAPRLSGVLFAVGALVDTFAAGLFVCLLTLSPVPTLPTSAAAGYWMPLRPAWGCAVVSAVLLALHGVARNRLARVLYGLGIAFGLAAAGWAAAARWQTPNAGLCWIGGVALVCGLVLEGVYRHGVCALAGSMVGGLLLLLADRELGADLVPARMLWGGADGQTARSLGLLAAAGAQALAWGLGILTLGLILIAPQRRASVRTLSGAAYRALAVTVLLLAAGMLVGGLPRGRPVEVAAAVALVGLAVLLHARFAGWVQDLGLALGCTGAGVVLVLAACAAPLAFRGADSQSVRVLAWACCFAAANASLALHAARRYWFTSESCQ